MIAPGEVIEKKHLAYLREMGYNNKSKVQTAAGLSYGRERL